MSRANPVFSDPSIFPRGPYVRSDCSSSPASSKNDSYACFGIGKNFVRVQLKPEVSANIGKAGGAYIPQSPSELHRADEANLRQTNLRRLAARFENPAVKPNIMGCDKLRAKEDVLNSRPQLFERWFFTNMFPRNTVYGGKEERVSGWPNQIVLSVYDPIALYANQPDRASAVGAVVSSLEVEANKNQRGLPSCRAAAIGNPWLQARHPSFAAGQIV